MVVGTSRRHDGEFDEYDTDDEYLLGVCDVMDLDQLPERHDRNRMEARVVRSRRGGECLPTSF